MNRKPIFDAVRAMLGRGFKTSEVEALDAACDRADSALETAGDMPEASPGAHQLGALSELYESGGRGPGTVSGGLNDPGGVSYGVYQLASKAGTCAAFVSSEGRRWADRFGRHAPGSVAFSQAWKAIASEQPAAFRRAQHAFIQRTHYRPAVEAVAVRTGLDLDSRSPAVRDATWSCAVQHGGAAKIVGDAVQQVDRAFARTDPEYDRALIEAIYRRRADYVRAVAQNPRLRPAVRKQLVVIAESRYRAELRKALAMLDTVTGATRPAPA